MRLRIRAIGLSLLVIALGWAQVPAIGADADSALATLKELGLTKSGRTFLIEAEKPVLARLKEVKASASNYATLLDRQVATEQAATQLTQLEERRVELQENLADMNQRIVEQGGPQGGNMGGRPGQGGFAQGGGLAAQMIAQRDQVKFALAEIKQQQQSLKAEAAQVKERSAMEADVKAKGDALKASLAEVRPMIDEVTKKYADLAADKSAKAAIAELERAGKASLKLGPSDAFVAAVKAIDQAEQRLLGKKATPVSRKKARSKK